MSDNMQELRHRIRKMEHLLEFLAEGFQQLSKGAKPSKWMSEKEAMEAIGIKISLMRKLRRNGVLVGYSSTNRNFKYLRTEVEDYIEGRKGAEVYKMRQKSSSQFKKTI